MSTKSFKSASAPPVAAALHTGDSRVIMRLPLFILISLVLHALVFIVAPGLLSYRSTPEKPALETASARETEPVFIDVVSLPPDAEGIEEEPLTRERIAADRNLRVDKETVPPESAPLPPAAPEPANDNVANVTGVAGPSGVPPELAEVTGGAEKAEIQRPHPPTLFPTDERLDELARQYQQKAPPRERGKVLALNTSELKYHKYLLNMKRRIEFYWSYPHSSQRRGEQGRLRVDFSIAKDGSVTAKEIQIIKSSNYPALDDAAITAIRLASPFNPFPPNFDIETVDIHANFEYSLSYR